MPFSELLKMAKGKLESTQSKMINSPVDPTFPSDNEFVELVWENGQVMMQGQSSRTRKSTSVSGVSSITSKAEKDRGDAGISKIGRFGTMDSMFNDFSSPGPSGQMGLGHDDEMVPWLNYPFDETLPHDYCSDFMSELTGANSNALSAHTDVVPNVKNTSYSQIVRDSHIGSLQGGAKPEQRNVSKVSGLGLDPSRPGSSWLCSSMPHQNQSSVPFLRSSVSDFARSNTNDTHRAPCENSTATPATLAPVAGMPDIAVQKQDPRPRKSAGQLNNNTGLMNFSHFSRPVALSKPNLPNISCAAAPDRLRSSEKVSSVVSCNPMESTVIDSTSVSPSLTGFQNKQLVMSGKMDLKPSSGKPIKNPPSTEQSEATSGENLFTSSRSIDQAPGQTSSFAASAAAGRPEKEKDVEPVVGSSSMCSGSSAGGTSNEPKDTLKRKSQDADESECQSEDVEEESIGVRKAATTRGGTGAKRTRAAEVHNLSERRRRDRINEKMRALQELIPNCNKVDKASMLDEAIEYLKTLQLQVQIMSMGAGMYMPPMMLPTGMHAPQFSPMGVGMGMGMGMGFGMGMLDMSSGRPMMMPHMHGMQFPRSTIPGSNGLPMMGGSGVQMLGFPGQGLPLSMPRPPYVHLSEGPSTRSVSVPDISGTTNLLEGPNPAIPSSSKGIVQNTNLQTMATAGGECSRNQTITQSQATKEDFRQPLVVRRDAQGPNVNDNEDINVANGNGTLTSGPTGYN